MEFLIDGEGRSTVSDDIATDDAVWQAGFIHLHQVDADSVVVRLRPDVVHGKTLASALYQLADLAPEYVVCTADPYGRRAQLIVGSREAQVAIARLIGAVQIPAGSHRHTRRPVFCGASPTAKVAPKAPQLTNCESPDARS